VFRLGPRSLARLKGVHPDLVKVVERAIRLSSVDFTVLEGVRDPMRQRKLVEAGASQTLNSRHLTGHAVDLGAWVDDEVRWDWPLYHKIAAAMKAAAAELQIPIEWGGDWKKFKDGPHFQLPWKDYP
jgi:peptidoglycan L-alanyl-D-glutamate endopeptidase CwlK